ncbi:12537_t:CDS:2, partial [Acaulospora colombiana]
SYPSLESIKLEAFMEYDILMIMLERRNLLTGPFIKKITKLHLLNPYPPEIRPVLRTLLDCKWVKRPSNRELSLACNAEIILDLSLLEAEEVPTADSERQSILKQLQEYPNSDDEVLATWEKRAGLWDTLNKAGGGRLAACSGNWELTKDIKSWD